MSLPVPTDLSRQVGISETGSPIVLSRGTSDSSANPDQAIQVRLLIYKNYLEHELTFTKTELQALDERAPSQDPHEEEILIELQKGLTIRVRRLERRLTNVCSLLDALEN